MLLGKRFITAAVVLAFSVSSAVAAAPKSGKVRLVIGDVTFQKGGKNKWQPLRVDAKVKEKDRIKTAFESTASIAFPANTASRRPTPSRGTSIPTLSAFGRR